MWKLLDVSELTSSVAPCVAESDAQSSLNALKLFDTDSLRCPCTKSWSDHAKYLSRGIPAFRQIGSAGKQSTHPIDLVLCVSERLASRITLLTLTSDIVIAAVTTPAHFDVSPTSAQSPPPRLCSPKTKSMVP